MPLGQNMMENFRADIQDDNNPMVVGMEIIQNLSFKERDELKQIQAQLSYLTLPS